MILDFSLPFDYINGKEINDTMNNKIKIMINYLNKYTKLYTELTKDGKLDDELVHQLDSLGIEIDDTINALNNKENA